VLAVGGQVIDGKIRPVALGKPEESPYWPHRSDLIGRATAL